MARPTFGTVFVFRMLALPGVEPGRQNLIAYAHLILRGKETVPYRMM
jgi:hypothetical protein